MLYIVAANLFQIFGLYQQYPILDVIWKAVILLYLIAYAAYKAPRPLRIYGGYWAFFLGFLLYQVLNPIVSGDLPASLSDIVALIIPPTLFFIFMILFNNVSMNAKVFEKFLKLFIAFVIFACVFNFVVNYGVITSITSDVEGYQLALSSFFDNRNTFGFYLFLGIVSNIFLLLNKQTRSVILYTTLAIMLTSLLLTLSRTSIIALIVCLTCFLILQNRTMLYVKGFLIAGAMGLVIILSPSLLGFIKENIIRADSGLTGRDYVYSSALNIAQDTNILFGAGYNSSIETLNQSTGYSSTHNSYLSVLVRGGVILFGMFVMGIIFSIRKILQVRKSNVQLGDLLLSILVGYLIYSFTESRVFFFSSVPDFIVTVFVILVPLYLSNWHKVRSVTYKKQKITGEIYG